MERSKGFQRRKPIKEVERSWEFDKRKIDVSGTAQIL
jgi:hypothetical protein